MDSLPADRDQRLAQLRSLLTTETDQLSRHYLHELLIAELYRLRERTADGLAAFDAAAVAHDHDIALIRPALMTKFGAIPLVETYRFGAIRHAKAGDFVAAQWWSDQGLEVYGQDALRPDAVEDLQSLAARYWHRLNPDPSAPVTHAAGPTPARPAGAASPGDESLVCQTCGTTFRRPRVRGRKPHHCPACRPGGDLSSHLDAVPE